LGVDIKAHRENNDRSLFWYGIFFMSGLVALTYEVSWQRILGIFYGADNITATVVISVFLFGLGIGAHIGGVIADRARNPFALYAWCEFAIGVIGASSLYLIPRIGTATAGVDIGIVLSIVSAILIVPTVLMGMTLPLFVEGYSRRILTFRRALPSLYMVNLLGAATGALLAVYVLISLLGLTGSIVVAASFNLLLGALVLRYSRGSSAGALRPKSPSPVVNHAPHSTRSFQLMATAFVVGFASISLQVSWYRVLSHLTKSSPYAFSTTLFVFLLALACGSYWSYVSLMNKRSWFDEAATMIFAALTTMLSMILLVHSDAVPGLGKMLTASVDTIVHPTVSYNPDWSLSLKIWKSIDVFFWAGFVLFVPTVFLGRVLPTLIVQWQELGHARGNSIGKMYLTNIVGNIGGAVVTGILLFQWLGFIYAIELVCIFLVAYAALTSISSFRPIKVVGLGMFAASLVLFPSSDDIQRVLLLGSGASNSQNGKLAAVEEGRIAVASLVGTNVIETLEYDELTLHINGLAQAYRALVDPLPPKRIPTTPLVALALVDRPAKVLVLGFGLGGFVHVLLSDERVEQVTIVEVSPEVIALARRVPIIRRDLEEKRINVVIDDARRFLHRSDDTWDLIITDAIRSTTSMSGRLYSEEFYQLAASRLAHNGLFAAYNSASPVAMNTARRVFNSVVPRTAFNFCSHHTLSLDLTRIRSSLNRLTDNDAGRKSLIDYIVDFDELDSAEKRSNLFNTDLFPRDEFSLWLGHSKLKN
jgi:predicted membrane-bound spermidine synthase